MLIALHNHSSVGSPDVSQSALEFLLTAKEHGLHGGAVTNLNGGTTVMAGKRASSCA